MNELEVLQMEDEGITMTPREIDNIVRKALQGTAEELEADEMEIIYDVVYNAVTLTESHLKLSSTY